MATPRKQPDMATRAGGLPHLLNLMTRAGLPDIDDALQAALCLRVLHLFLARAGAESPLTEALPELPETPLALPDPVPACHPSAACLAALPGALRLARVPGLPGRRALLSARGAVLGLVSGEALGRLARRLGRNRFRLAGRVISKDNLAAALPKGLMLALQWHVFRLTDRGWRAAVSRPGYLETSATHIDITLDLDDVRLPERLAGLDFNPGWVPWLSRVVTLHFGRFSKPPREAP